MDFLQIKIVGWDKFNGRKDITNPTWFRVQYRLLEDPEFYHFTHAEMVVWFYMMAQACRKASDTVLISYQHARATRKLSRDQIISAVRKLEALKLIEVNASTRYVHDTRQDRTGQDRTGQDETNRTEQNKTEHTTPTAAVLFDFESAYAKYPRKLGKAKGIQALSKQIRCQSDFDSFQKAVENYAQAVSGTEEKYIKHFSSFVGTEKSGQPWREYVDYSPSKPKSAIDAFLEQDKKL